MADPIVHAIQPDYNYGPIVAICGLPFYGSNACMNVFAGPRSEEPVTCPGCLALRGDLARLAGPCLMAGSMY